MASITLIDCDCGTQIRMSTIKVRELYDVTCPGCGLSIDLDDDTEEDDESDHTLPSRAFSIRGGWDAAPAPSCGESQHGRAPDTDDGPRGPDANPSGRAESTESRKVRDELSIRTGVKLLSEEFLTGPPQQPPHASTTIRPRSRIARIQRVFALFRAADGYPAARIAREMDISESSIRRILKAVRDDIEQFIILGFAENMKSVVGDSYVCRYCGWSEHEGPAIARHCYGHFWSVEELRVSPRGI